MTRAKETKTKYGALIIEKMPRGGFLVREWSRETGIYNMPIYSSKELDDVFKFIKQEMS